MNALAARASIVRDKCKGRALRAEGIIEPRGRDEYVNVSSHYCLPRTYRSRSAIPELLHCVCENTMSIVWSDECTTWPDSETRMEVSFVAAM